MDGKNYQNEKTRYRFLKTQTRSRLTNWTNRCLTKLFGDPSRKHDTRHMESIGGLNDRRFHAWRLRILSSLFCDTSWQSSPTFLHSKKSRQTVFGRTKSSQLHYFVEISGIRYCYGFLHYLLHAPTANNIFFNLGYILVRTRINEGKMRWTKLKVQIDEVGIICSITIDGV